MGRGLRCCSSQVHSRAGRSSTVDAAGNKLGDWHQSRTVVPNRILTLSFYHQFGSNQFNGTKVDTMLS
ncbi:hypothetical protein GQ600_1974 [Phytophthora cactorum]|nr:hypothetical protein GQ600_1974 [Phytophthora cactorum]